MTHPLYTARELEHQLSDSGARCIIVLENFAHTLQDVIASTAIEHVVTTSVGELLRQPKGLIVDLVIRHVKRAVPSYSLRGAVKMRSALRRGSDEVLDEVEIGFAFYPRLWGRGLATEIAEACLALARNELGVESVMGAPEP